MAVLSDQYVSFYFVRHGKLETEQVLAGHTDFALCEQGKADLMAALTQYRAKIEQVISSPLTRCQLVAEQFADTFEFPLVVEPSLKEMDFGDWDGKSFNELWQKSEQGYSIGDFWQNPWQYTPPNGESLRLFHERVINWWQGQLLKPQLLSSIVVTHAGVIKQIVSHILASEMAENDHFSRLNIDYAAVVHIRVFRDRSGKIWPQVCF